MNFDPQKFFIGLVDFFSILLPGALLTFLFMGQVGPAVLGKERYAQLSGAPAWVGFLFASYLFGHLIFLVGSRLDSVYDLFRSRTLGGQITQLADGGAVFSAPTRFLARLLFKDERNRAVRLVSELKAKALAPVHGADAINTFQWSKAYLNANSPASMAVVQRFEADSKFFRCFTVVLVILLITWPLHQMWPLVSGNLVLLVLLLLAFWRFVEQRHKATNQAYWAVMTLMAQDERMALTRPRRRESKRRYSAGAVHRMWGDTREYLLVASKDSATGWQLPRGPVAEGESLREAAVRHVATSTGVWARVDQDLDETVRSADGGAVSYFVMAAAGRARRNEAGVWEAFGAALGKVSPVERTVLQRANTLV